MTGKDGRVAIGIDLGPRYSCVCVWDESHNRVRIIPNSQGDTKTPSFVAFTPTECLIGNGAMNQVTLNPTNTIFDVTRLLGRRFRDPEVQECIKSWPFIVIEGTNGLPKVVVSYKGNQKKYSAEQISSMVLLELKTSAESYLGKIVKEAVITVPAYFNDSQHQATKVAAHLAELDVLQITSKPAAAAIAYGLHKQTVGKNVLVFDLDDDTFDVSLLTVDEMVMLRVKATCFTHFGDQKIVDTMVVHFVKEFKSKNMRNITLNSKALGRLRIASEKAIQVLFTTTEASLDIDCLYDGIDFSTRITRAKFEDINMRFFKKCIETLEKFLRDAKINKRDVDDIVLIGEWTRIPKVQHLLQEIFNHKPHSKSINVDEVVAYGAAIHAANLIEKSEKAKTLTLDVVPLSLVVETHDGVSSVRIWRNTSISTEKTQIHAADLIFEESEKAKTLPLLDVVPLSLGVATHDGVFSVIIPRNTHSY